MSGHGHGHDHPSLAGWGSGFALGYSLPPGAPRRRCACRVITETPLALTPLSRARGATVSSGGSTTSSNPGVDAAQSDSPATGGTGGGASAADGAAGQSGGDAPAAGGSQTDAAIADGQSASQADVSPLGEGGTDRDGNGGGDAGATNDNRPPESTDASPLADVSGSVDVAGPASTDTGSNLFNNPQLPQIYLAFYDTNGRLYWSCMQFAAGAKVRVIVSLL
jgi:hypothetical protein